MAQDLEEEYICYHSTFSLICGQAYTTINNQTAAHPATVRYCRFGFDFSQTVSLSMQTLECNMHMY